MLGPVVTDDQVRAWLVARTVDDRDLVTLTYATPDGERVETRQLAATHLQRSPATAAVDVPPADLDPVTDPDRRERFAAEAERMRASHAPDDEV